jgi:predicted transcriptional regulator
MTTTTVRITDSRLLREDDELMARVDALAKKTRRTRSAMLAILVEEALDERDRLELTARSCS